MIDDVIASIQIFKITSDIGGFQSWLREYHGFSDFKPFFIGYKYFLNVSSIMILDAINDDCSLRLKEDHVYQHAIDSVGLQDLPNSCEKVIVLKNLWSSFEKICSAEDWDDLAINLHRISDTIQILDKVVETAKENPEVSRATACRRVTLLHAFNELNNTAGGEPVGAKSVLFYRFTERSSNNEQIVGFSYALEYLWCKLLGKSEFEVSPAKELHKAADFIQSGDIGSFIGREHSLGSSLYEADPESYMIYAAWKSIDDRYEDLLELHIRPIHYAKTESFFSLPKNYKKDLLKPLLDRTAIKEPEYFYDQVEEGNLFKWIDYLLEWFPVNFLDTQKLWDYSGVFAFIPFLIGLTTVVKERSKGEKIHVLRIRHPVEHTRGYFYSYAVLNENPLFDEVGRGWIIFLTCATDYSGHGGAMYERAEHYIKRFESEGLINVRQIDVDEENFKYYLNKKVRDAPREEDISLEVILDIGENEEIEFKSSLLWSSQENCKRPEVTEDVVKGIAAFLNANGGTVLIGVSDDRHVLGLHHDYSLLGSLNHRNRDGFERRLNEAIIDMLGKEHRQYINVRFKEDLEGKDVCLVKVDPAPEPVFLKSKGKGSKSVFVVRSGNTSQTFEVSEFYQYAKKHWGLRMR